MTVIDAPPLVSEQQGPFTVTQLLGRATAILTAAGVPTPDVDAELLAGHVLGVARGQIQAYAITERPLSAADAVALLDLVERRATREPLQHLLGRAYFRTLELEVGPGVFVPRPETEFVSGLAVQALRSVAAAQPIAVDLGTGSGAIALSMATEVPHSFVYGVENSAAAFVWTTQNFRRIAPHNAKPVFIDLADALPDLDGQVSVVASNPPYIPLAAVPRDPEVRLYDPAHALYGGVDGLDIVRQVSTTSRRLLSAGGSLIIEHGELQSAEIAALLRSDGWNAVSGHRDLTGRDRATTAVR